jgi:hypothetical protein
MLFVFFLNYFTRLEHVIMGLTLYTLFAFLYVVTFYLVQASAQQEKVRIETEQYILGLYALVAILIFTAFYLVRASTRQEKARIETEEFLQELRARIDALEVPRLNVTP